MLLAGPTVMDSSPLLRDQSSSSLSRDRDPQFDKAVLAQSLETPLLLAFPKCWEGQALAGSDELAVRVLALEHCSVAGALLLVIQVAVIGG